MQTSQTVAPNTSCGADTTSNLGPLLFGVPAAACRDGRRYDAVIEDCDSVLEGLDGPDNAKALFRRGQALVRAVNRMGCVCVDDMRVLILVDRPCPLECLSSG